LGVYRALSDDAGIASVAYKIPDGGLEVTVQLPTHARRHQVTRGEVIG
jgi:hypothetical protein